MRINPVLIRLAVRFDSGMRDVSKEHYFEAHVTIEPIGNPDVIQMVQEWAAPWGFRMATLLMRKRAEDTAVRSADDMFLTARSYDGRKLEAQTKMFVSVLNRHAIQVWRYKIEQTLVDSMYNPALLPRVGGYVNIPEKYLNPRDPVSN